MPVKLPPKSMMSATPDELRDARGLKKENRLRPIDSAIFHRAEADAAMRRLDPLAEVQPTKKQLMGLLARKTDPKTVAPVRGYRKPHEEDEFYKTYEAATS